MIILYGGDYKTGRYNIIKSDLYLKCYKFFHHSSVLLSSLHQFFTSKNNQNPHKIYVNHKVPPFFYTKHIHQTIKSNLTPTK